MNHAKHHRAAKREVDEGAAVVQPMGVDLIALDQALDKLATLDPRQSRIVELRFFGGLTEEEIADVLGVYAITVKRDWRIASSGEDVLAPAERP